MELNSHLSELSTSTQSSGYNSSTASSSLNFIDDQEQQSLLKVDGNNNRDIDIDNQPPATVTETVATKLIITITLVKFDDREEEQDSVDEVFESSKFAVLSKYNWSN